VDRLAGMAVDGKAIQEFIKGQPENDKTGWLFHARAASIGPKVPELLQPIVGTGGLFVHNGHWTEWEKVFWPLLAMGCFREKRYVNDSHTAAALVDEHGSDTLRWLTSGVFVSWGFDGKVVLQKRTGQFAMSGLPKEDGGGVIYASSFPGEWPCKVWEVDDKVTADLGPRKLPAETLKLRWEGNVYKGRK